MHETKAPAKGCHILSRTGEIQRFEGLEALVATLVGRQTHKGHWSLADYLDHEGYVDAFDHRTGPVRGADGATRPGWIPIGTFVVRDEEGATIPIEAIARLGRRRVRRRRHPMPAFRDGSVPNTGHARRRRYRHVHRHMRTTQERREGRFKVDARAEREVVPKGRVREPRNAWDDVVRRTQRSWKSFRRTRWVAR